MEKPRWLKIWIMRSVSDTSPLSALALIGRLFLLQQQLNEVEIPEEVWLELKRLERKEARDTPCAAKKEGWLKIVPIRDKALASALALTLDLGEAEAITLALDPPPARLIIDEIEGRTVARNLGVPVVSTLGVLLKAKQEGVIASLADEMKLLCSEAGFFIAAPLHKRFLEAAGEV